MNIIVMGPPGAGKGTQARRLSDLLHVPHVASGDLFRDIVSQDTDQAREIQRYMDLGQYVPDEITIGIVLARLHMPDAREGFILDGFPRTEPQAEALDAKLAAGGRKVDLALYVTVAKEVLLERIAGRLVCPQCKAIYHEVSNPPARDHICDVCGHVLERRADEAPEVVTTRLDTYKSQTRPLIEYYTRQGILKEIDGGRPIDVVNAEIDDAVRLRPTVKGTRGAAS
jgi:adenylate kinase